MICNKCKIEKPVSDFRVNRIKSNSFTTAYNSLCNFCLDKYKNSKPLTREEKSIIKSETRYWELYQFKTIVRLNILGSFKRKNISKPHKTEEILGCSIVDFKKHLESLFTEGMTWENRGRKGWHIDHIIPLVRAKTEEEVLKLCHYTNLQPLWEQDNLRKSKK